MSKRIVISETEKERIKSLYINESTSLEGQIFQVNVDGDLRNYRITQLPCFVPSHTRTDFITLRPHLLQVLS